MGFCGERDTDIILVVGHGGGELWDEVSESEQGTMR